MHDCPLHACAWPLPSQLPSKQRHPDTMPVPHPQRSRPAPAPQSARAPQSGPVQRSRPAPPECAEHLERQEWETEGRTASAGATSLVSGQAHHLRIQCVWLLAMAVVQGAEVAAMKAGRSCSNYRDSRQRQGQSWEAYKGRQGRQLCQQRRKGVCAAPPIEKQRFKSDAVHHHTMLEVS